ncbi:MAG: iron-sulfur cluster repair di-iron protein [Candidatus Brocadiaceae bacterium]|nr:iron-sulfur cluster repair di-iron protein [Candidatus Brocadiaceae bacterium]
MNTNTGNQTVGDLVTERPAVRPALERYGIDYCCGGDRPLAEAAAAAGVDLRELCAAMDAAEADAPEGGRDWSQATLTELVAHIEGAHHAFLREAFPRIEALFTAVLAAHQARHGKVLRPLREVFGSLRTEIEQHLEREESLLFPYVRRLEEYVRGGGRQPAVGSERIRNPVRVMRLEHDDAGQALSEMRGLTDGYRLPEDACRSFRALYDALQELERDLHEHIHLENNILFRKAVALDIACWGV